MTVVCAGVKSILDIPLTLERLETLVSTLPLVYSFAHLHQAMLEILTHHCLIITQHVRAAVADLPML